MRLFFAVEIPDAIRDDIANATSDLRRQFSRARWIAPELLHITIKFLGECEPRSVNAITEAADSVASQGAPFDALLRGAGAFPNFLAPRVVWIGMRYDTSFSRLAERLDRVLVDHGFPAERRPFRPHLTLGRIKTPLARDEASLFERSLRTVDDRWALRVRYLSLMQSELSATGPHYTRIASIPLGRS